jgi:transposase
VGVEPLIEDIEVLALLADKAFDIDWLRAELDNRGAQAIIPPKANRKQAIACDFHMYRWRHLIENFFCKLKAFRRIATRYEKTDKSFSAMIHLVGTVLAIR